MPDDTIGGVPIIGCSRGRQQDHGVARTDGSPRVEQQWERTFVNQVSCVSGNLF